MTWGLPTHLFLVIHVGALSELLRCRHPVLCKNSVAACAAPTQSEPPFLVAQLVVLALFVVLGFLSVRKFHPKAV
jgi:hypothetical protein